ncbi:MAG: hypothetical protein SFU25_07685 [Candidatus Caenarcaniphilales bacterium]|nr:hypothetical protein [Candidatus Caenarcaniphilales bacterium]
MKLELGIPEGSQNLSIEFPLVHRNENLNVGLPKDLDLWIEALGNAWRMQKHAFGNQVLGYEINFNGEQVRKMISEKKVTLCFPPSELTNLFSQEELQKLEGQTIDGKEYLKISFKA